MNRTNASRHIPVEQRLPTGRAGWLAGGGLLGGVLATACCVLPLALFSLGIGGAWIGTLTGLHAYQPIFAALALVFIGLGFWQLRHQRNACSVDGYCASTTARRVTTIALWGATGLVLLSLAWPWLAPGLLAL